MAEGQKPVVFGVGQCLFRQGEKGGELYFIQKGRVEVSVYNEGGDAAVVAVMEKNTVLGTMSFLEGEPRSATAKALTDVECIVVNEAQREKMLAQVPPWFKVLVKDMSAGLRNLNAKFAELQNSSRLLEKRLEAMLKKHGDGKTDDPEKK